MGADAVKYFFSSLMDGKVILARTPSTKSHLLGMPFTTDILIEIICFGYSHADSIVYYSLAIGKYYFVINFFNFRSEKTLKTY